MKSIIVVSRPYGPLVVVGTIDAFSEYNTWPYRAPACRNMPPSIKKVDPVQ